MLMRCFGTVALLVLWFLTTEGGIAPPALLPSPREVLLELFSMFSRGTLYLDLTSTLMRWSLGFGLGIILGVLSGLFLGLLPGWYRAWEFPVEFFRALPVTAIFPLFLLLFGMGDESKIAMAFLPTFLLTLVSSVYGVRNTAPDRKELAALYGASSFQILRFVVFPEALPQILVGIRLALSLSLAVTVVSEMFIGTEFGFGQRIYDSYLTNSVSVLYAMLVLLGVFGYGLNLALNAAERRFVFWAGR